MTILLALISWQLVVPVTSEAATGQDDYPADLKAAPLNATIDPWGFYNRNCTSFVAWRMNQLLGRTSAPWAFTNSMGGGHWGNANTWDDNARQLGYPVDSSPSPGAIAQTDAGSFGHVAVVMSVSGPNVTVEEYNANLNGNYGQRTLSAATFRYIHVPGVNPGGDPFGAVDRVVGQVGNFVSVQGWVIDPDAPATSGAVHIYIDGPAGSGARGVAVSANTSRPDVGAAFPGSGDAHGYATAIDGIGPGNHTVWIYAINVAGGGANRLLATASVSVPAAAPGSPFGNFEDAAGLSGGTASLRGWTIDPDDPTASTEVHVYVDGPAGSPGAAGYNLGRATVSRPDVAAAFPGSGDLHGFDTTITGLAPGTHTLYAYAINTAGGGDHPLLRAISVVVG